MAAIVPEEYILLTLPNLTSLIRRLWIFESGTAVNYLGHVLEAISNNETYLLIDLCTTTDSNSLLSFYLHNL